MTWAGALLLSIATGCVVVVDNNRNIYEDCGATNDVCVSSDCVYFSDLEYEATQGYYCTLACTSDSQCPGTGICAGGNCVNAVVEAGLYEYCSYYDDICLSPATTCKATTATWGLTEVTDYHCTLGCLADSDCPSVTVGSVSYLGWCENLDGNPYCYQGCSVDADCDLGFGCDTSAAPYICIPAP